MQVSLLAIRPFLVEDNFTAHFIWIEDTSNELLELIILNGELASKNDSKYVGAALTLAAIGVHSHEYGENPASERLAQYWSLDEKKLVLLSKEILTTCLGEHLFSELFKLSEVKEIEDA